MIYNEHPIGHIHQSVKKFINQSSPNFTMICECCHVGEPLTHGEFTTQLHPVGTEPAYSGSIVAWGIPEDAHGPGPQDLAPMRRVRDQVLTQKVMSNHHGKASGEVVQHSLSQCLGASVEHVTQYPASVPIEFHSKELFCLE